MSEMGALGRVFVQKRPAQVVTTGVGRHDRTHLVGGRFELCWLESCMKGLLR